ESSSPPAENWLGWAHAPALAPSLGRAPARSSLRDERQGPLSRVEGDSLRHHAGLHPRRRARLPGLPVRKSVPHGALLSCALPDRSGTRLRPDPAASLRRALVGVGLETGPASVSSAPAWGPTPCSCSRLRSTSWTRSAGAPLRSGSSAGPWIAWPSPPMRA